MPIAAGMYYACHEGEAEREAPVIFIHGAGSNQHTWPYLFRRLTGRRVLVPDLPGHGRSPGHSQHSVFTYADRLVQFLDELYIERAILVGHCLGGAIALAMGLEQAARVESLAIMGCGALFNVPSDIVRLSQSPEERFIAVESLAERSFGPKVSGSLVASHIQRMCETPVEVLHGDLLACAAFDIRTQASRISAPTLVMVGSEDQLTPPALAHWLVDHLPAARLRLFYGAGHMLMQEQTQAVCSALEGFLGEMQQSIHPQAI